MSLTEQQLSTWSRPVSRTEDIKCKNAVSQVTDAIREKFGYSVSIFLQGSYRNNTNVRQDSDVDIVVCHDGYYFPNLGWLTELQKAEYHRMHPGAAYTFTQFKSEIETKLQSVFGNVQRKNKCMLVNGNTSRVNADVIPCFGLKRFTDEYNTDAEGIAFNTDTGDRVESYPEQHCTNGVAKTNATNRMYKRIVRILKKIRMELINNNAITEELVSSFFIECLVYNVPNINFRSNDYSTSLVNVIQKIYSDMGNVELSNNYKEVSELRWLFRGAGRTAADAKLFMSKCWDYAGF